MALLDRFPAWSLAVVAMLSVQVGAAVSVGLFPEIGVAGTSWLRLTLAAVVLVLWVRPRYTSWTLRELRMPALLGVFSATNTMFFLAAIDRLPLGTAVAIEFLGPLSVAALHSKSRAGLGWAALALVGVLTLTEPWAGSVNLAGVLFAVAAGVGWAMYIVITQHVGDRFAGLDGLAISIPVAAVVAAVVGVPQAWGHLSWRVLLVGVVAAVLLPLIPYAFEMFALRRMTAGSFGTIMALEPAFGTLIGLLMLHQVPTAIQAVGVACVVIAGIGAERIGHRDEVPPRLESLGA